MLPIVFGMTAVLVIVLILTIVVSIVSPRRRIWPPPAQKSWQFFFVWIPTLSAFLGIIIVGVLDWNSLRLPALVRLSLGCGLVLIGNGLAWIGVKQLTMKATSGAEGELVTDGLYRYTRNPQYIGDILILLGWFIWSASIWVLPLTIGGILIFLLTPFAEESWLEKLYGQPYKSYRENVPRFLFWR